MKWLTPKEAADCLRIGKTRIYELLRAGLIPHRREGRRYFISPDGMQDYVRRTERKSAK